MYVFDRSDGEEIHIVPGYRERVLSERVSFSPRPDWNAAHYAAGARRQIERTQQLVDQYVQAGGRFEDARVLDVGCGDAISCLLIAAQQPVDEVIGIDLELPLVEEGERHERIRQLAAAVCRQIGIDENDVDRLLRRLPLRLEKMGATKMTLADGSVDFLRSRSALEHIKPAERAMRPVRRPIRSAPPYDNMIARQCTYRNGCTYRLGAFVTNGANPAVACYYAVSSCPNARRPRSGSSRCVAPSGSPSAECA